MNGFDWFRYAPLLIKLAPEISQLMQKVGPILDAVAKAEPDVVPLIKKISAEVDQFNKQV